MSEEKGLKVFRVVHHTANHETRTILLAYDRISASKMVKGQVMHVSEGESLHEGKSVASSAWNFSFREPEYNEPSEEWKEYLKGVNLSEGLEDAVA